jgi:hypothetical protein
LNYVATSGRADGVNKYFARVRRTVDEATNPANRRGVGRERVRPVCPSAHVFVDRIDFATCRPFPGRAVRCYELGLVDRDGVLDPYDVEVAETRIALLALRTRIALLALRTRIALLALRPGGPYRTRIALLALSPFSALRAAGLILRRVTARFLICSSPRYWLVAPRRRN